MTTNPMLLLTCGKRDKRNGLTGSKRMTSVEYYKQSNRAIRAEKLAEFLRRSAIASLLEVARDWSQHDWNVMAKRAGLVYRNGAVRAPSTVTQEMVIDLLKADLSQRSDLAQFTK